MTPTEIIKVIARETAVDAKRAQDAADDAKDIASRCNNHLIAMYATRAAKSALAAAKTVQVAVETIQAAEAAIRHETTVVVADAIATGAAEVANDIAKSQGCPGADEVAHATGRAADIAIKNSAHALFEAKKSTK